MPCPLVAVRKSKPKMQRAQVKCTILIGDDVVAVEADAIIHFVEYGDGTTRWFGQLLLAEYDFDWRSSPMFMEFEDGLKGEIRLTSPDLEFGWTTSI